jgi:hypothetical protein
MNWLLNPGIGNTGIGGKIEAGIFPGFIMISRGNREVVAGSYQKFKN